MGRTKSLKILSIEAKDIYAAMTLKNENPIGYNIRKPDGEISLRKFKNTLDWSLDTIKLQEEYYKATRKKNFFFVNNKGKFTQTVINVTFSYSFKEFNQYGRNAYVRAGYDLRDCEFKDGVCLKGGILIAVQTGVEVSNPIDSGLLEGIFSYTGDSYKQTGTIPVLMTKSDLRRWLYDNGFVCDGIKYVRYKRSAGSGRVGKCLFVDAVVSSRMSRWDRCGLTIREGDPIDLAAYEAYIALPMSSIIDTMQIPKESILIVDDAESAFEEKVVAVEEINGKLEASVKEATITNNIWDGESLLDESMFGEYRDKGMLLLRNRFFKTCAFNTNIQKWFADNGITEVSQLKGFTRATDISQIKLITTPSSVKYLKFGTVDQWLDNIEETFGVVKHEKETHFFGGRMVQCHYQLLNTLAFTESEIKTLLEDSFKYITAVRTDPDMLRFHIGYAFKTEEEEDEIKPYKTKNDIVFKLLGINDKFASTQVYKSFRNAVVKGFLKNLKRGHLLVDGNYSTLLGNGLELLQASIGAFTGESVIPKGCIHSRRFEYGKEILGSRSPHVTMGNILLVKNVGNELIEKYFNMSNEIVYINAIGENTLQRLSGADYDSDTMLLTDNPILVGKAKENYEVYKVPTSLVRSKKTRRHYTAEDKADLDVKTSVNKIGEIVNLSQQLNSLYWDRLHSGSTVEQEEELYNDVCKLDVLSGIEIDKAKKEFTIDSGKEIDALKAKYRLEDNEKQVKPMFFKMITTENGYKLNDKTVYRYFKTSMDYYQKVINSFNFRMARKYKEETIPFMDIVKVPESKCRAGYYYHVKDQIIEILLAAKAAISQAYVGYDEMDKEERQIAKERAAEARLEYMQIVDDLSENEYLMYLVLKEMDNPKYRALRMAMFEILFGKPNEVFIKMINESREDLHEIIEEKGGEISLYGREYSRKIRKNLHF